MPAALRFGCVVLHPKAGLKLSLLRLIRLCTLLVCRNLMVHAWGKNIGGGDASGGKHSDTPKLRRVGWPFAILKIDPLEECQYQFDWGKLGQALGAQTINRGETWALIMFLVEATRLGCASSEYTTDSQYVLRGFKKCLKGKLPNTHTDVWKKIWSHMKKNPIEVV